MDASRVHRTMAIAFGPGVALVAAVLSACSGGATSTTALTTAAPTSTPVAALPELTQSFTSGLYGYSVGYPASFSTRSATEQLQGTEPPIIDSPVVDQLTGAAGGVIVLASAALPKPMTPDDWAKDTTRAFCGSPSTSEAITVGGEAGTLDTFASCKNLFHQWATTVHDRRGYHVVWVHVPGTEAADRALFLEILNTFEFGASAPSPGGSAAAAADGQRPIEAGNPVPDAVLGDWYHRSGAFLRILRAGDSACLAMPRTSQDCAIWQPTDGRRFETAILTIVDERLAVQWVQGGCAGTATYSFGVTGDRLNLRLVGGCQSGDFALTRAGTGAAPTAPPLP
jgi:hypothetical protein